MSLFRVPRSILSTFQEAKGIAGTNYLKLNEKISSSSIVSFVLIYTHKCDCPRLLSHSLPGLAMNQYKPSMRTICLCADFQAGMMKDISKL